MVRPELLARAVERLSRTPPATDRLMLTKWRVLSACQYLLGGAERELESACRAALEAFVAHGPGTASDEALKLVGAAVKRGEGVTDGVLPPITKAKRDAVSAHLDTLAAAGRATITDAMHLLPALRGRVSGTVRALSFGGIGHRFELVAGILEDPVRAERDRIRAAAAVLCVGPISNAVSDAPDVIEMLDHDYSLRVVLEELRGRADTSFVHWSENVSSLWNDMPFLQGADLHRGDNPIPVTWLDRVNSYVSYSHVLGSERAPLILLQPSIASSPLHAIVTLIGLLVLDAVTSSQRKVDALIAGRRYAFDRHVAVYEGVTSDERIQGWLRLRFRNGHAYANPALANQMLAVKNERALTDAAAFQAGAPGRDPLRRFFNWDSPIGPASISTHIVLVTSHRRALEILERVQSNGVSLIEHKLTEFLGIRPDTSDAHGKVLLVVPSLSVARMLLEAGVLIQSVLVDGYQRLHSGRHDLPFLLNHSRSPPIINWSPSGYFPYKTPSWLPPHKSLEASPDDLANILELDDTTDLARASLREAAAGMSVQAQMAPTPPAEAAVVDAVDAYLEAVRASQALPEYWRYHLSALARGLRTLIAATPSEWSSIRKYASAWSSSIDEKWSSLRPSAFAGLSDLRHAERRVIALIADTRDPVNSRATALSAFLSERAHAAGQWRLVCDRLEQAKIAASAFRELKIDGIEPVLLRDLAVCSSCVVTGWTSSSFVRRLWAHTPRELVAITDETDRRRWERAAGARRQPGAESVLSAVGGVRQLPSHCAPPSAGREEHRSDDNIEVEWGSDERVPCVFLWVNGESETKVLQPDARVVVEQGDVVRERMASRLRPDDRVILGMGTSRWSPADEFTGAVVDAVETSHPELVETAKEWRRALRRMVETQRLSAPQLRVRLAAVGVGREDQTIEGWLEVERASPIAPRGVRNELAALWPLVEPYAGHSLDDVATACTRLRALRIASGRALLQLWKGQEVTLGVSETWLDQLVDRLRREVQVCEVNAVTFGEVPRAMLGWWIDPELAGKFESESTAPRVISEVEEEDDSETA